MINMNHIFEKLMICEENIIKFQAITGFSFNDFIQLYMQGNIQITSDKHDIEKLREFCNKYDAQTFNNNYLKFNAGELSINNKLLGKVSYIDMILDPEPHINIRYDKLKKRRCYYEKTNNYNDINRIINDPLFRYRRYINF